MEELRKVTLNFYAEDIEFLEKFVGQGWSGEIREIVRQAILRLRDKEDNYAERDPFGRG